MELTEVVTKDKKGSTKALEKGRVKALPLKLIIITALPLVAFIISFAIGRYPIAVPDIVTIFFCKIFGIHGNWAENVETVIFSVRMPRILIAMLVGGAFAMSGATYQGLFKNPMVSPDILGASAGAGFGACLGILLSFGIFGIQLSSFIFGLLAVALTFIISNVVARGNNVILVLVLTGMVVSTLFSSFISITKYLADPYSKLPAITFWLMGGLSTISMSDVKIIIVPFILGAVPLILVRWRLNVLSFGEEEAKAMGVDTFKLRILLIICSTLLTASAVSVCGMVGWIGLVIPHLARMLVGPNYKVLLPVSLFIGSSFLVLVDDVARSAFALEIPLGILTALIGAPFFIFLLTRGKRGWI